MNEPGIGKAHFAKCLSSAMGTGYEFVPMAFGNAKLDGHDELQLKDLDASRIQRGKTRMGL